MSVVTKWADQQETEDQLMMVWHYQSWLSEKKTKQRDISWYYPSGWQETCLLDEEMTAFVLHVESSRAFYFDFHDNIQIQTERNCLRILAILESLPWNVVQTFTSHQRMNVTDFVDALIFPLAPPAAQKFNWILKWHVTCYSSPLCLFIIYCVICLVCLYLALLKLFTVFHAVNKFHRKGKNSDGEHYTCERSDLFYVYFTSHI